MHCCAALRFLNYLGELLEYFALILINDNYINPCTSSKNRVAIAKGTNNSLH